jgi:hypothetical protein
MAAKESNALSGHPALDTAAAQGLSQVHQILQQHIFCNSLRAYIAVADKQIA